MARRTLQKFSRILVKLASAFHHIHKKGFVHKDLKVKNAKELILVILDFGEATRIGNDFKRR